MTKLVLATREQETFENAFAQQIAAFRQTFDVEIEVVARPIHEHYALNIEACGLRSGGVDLYLCCTDWVPEAVEKGLFLALDSRLEANPPLDWPGGWHPAMLGLQRVGGETFGVPWHDGPEVFHYRTDLFEDEVEKSRYRERFGRELEPPKTWSEFLDTAVFFTRPEIGLWGCCEGVYTDGHNNVYDFLIQLWSRGGELFDPEGRPCFDDAIGCEALEFYRDLFHRHKVISPECLTMGSVEVGDFYAQGHAAMMWNWCGFAAVAEMPEYSRIVGKNACTTLPAGDGPGMTPVSLNIYWVMAVSSASRHADLAYEFIRHFTSPEMDKVTSMAGANGVRLSTWNDPEVRAKYPYYSIIESVHAGTRTLPAFPQYPAVNEQISLAVHRVIHEGADVALSLATAARAAAEILGVNR